VQDTLSVCSSQTGGISEDSTVDEDRISVHSADNAKRSPIAGRHEWDATLPLGTGFRSGTSSQNSSFNRGHNHFDQPEVCITIPHACKLLRDINFVNFMYDSNFA